MVEESLEGSHSKLRATHRPRQHSLAERPRDPDAFMEGWLRKRGTRLQSLWSDRYFVLKSDQLFYYIKAADTDVRGIYVLDRSCLVSEVKSHHTAYDRKKVTYAFRVLWPEAIETTELATVKAEGDPDGAQIPPSSRKEEDTDHSHTSRSNVSSANLSRGASNSSKATPDNNDKARREASVPGGTVADVAMDPYVQSPYLPPPPTPALTKVFRSAQSFSKPANPEKGRRVATPSQSSSGHTTTLATGGAMVAMAVGGVVVGALTAGVGLVAPMIVAGVAAAAGGGATVYGASTQVRIRQLALVLASDSEEKAEEWRNAIEAQIRWSQSMPPAHWMTMVGLDQRIPKGLSRRTPGRGPTAATKLNDIEKWTRSTRWKPWSVCDGMRVYELDYGMVADKRSGKKRRRSGALEQLPCRRVQVAVRGSPLETFITLVSIPCRIVNGIIDSMRILERLDDQSDVIYMSLRPLFLWPTWTAPRDFCLVRYWRYDEDGTYIICFDSTTHRLCPPVEGNVRADLHAVYIISPKKQTRHVEFDDSPECLLTYILQVNPRGWVWSACGYLDTFISEILFQVLDIRDILETDRFTAVHVDTSEDQRGGKEISSGPATSAIETHKATIPAGMWAEVDASTFVVRGPGYAESKLKLPSDKAAFRLLGVDLFDLAQPIDNIANHPNNRVQVALKQDDCPPFVFVVQLQFPGAINQLGYVTYFTPTDMALLEEDSPLSRLMRPFFFGEDDGFRDQRFKLIPKIVEGNWVVRKSVGTTPAIMGTKLKQSYYKGPNNRYFELDVNIASSSVAAGVVRLAAGYAKTLVVDLALVIQGEEENELPERVLACWRIKNLDLSDAKPIEN